MTVLKKVLLLCFLASIRRAPYATAFIIPTRATASIECSRLTNQTPPTCLPPLHKVHCKSFRPESKLNASFSAASSAFDISARGINSYWLVRVAILRSLGFVYIIAFLVALHQNRALIGKNGITPATTALDAAEARAKLKHQRRLEWEKERENYKYPKSENRITNLKNAVWRSAPYEYIQQHLLQPFYRYFWDRTDSLDRPLVTLLWLVRDRETNLDRSLDAIAYLGLFLSCVLFACGAANVPILVMLWLCQRSLMSVGGPWYGFGWETMLAELNFHAIFLVPVLSMSSLPVGTPVPMVAIYALRWFIFRIMMGAGLIKLRSGDVKWKDLTVMNYFYETMPVPNMFTRYFHQMPEVWHKFEALMNHVVELVAPWLLILPLVPRSWRINAALLQILFQCTIIASGNFSFLNWLTMIPVLACLDDDALSKLCIPLQTTSASVATYTYLSAFGGTFPVCPQRVLVSLFFGALIAKLSIPVVQNLLSKKQKMNFSFDKLRLVNTYGAFGVVNEERIELIVEAAESIGGPWKEYSFKVKPGDVMRPPRFISPYHYRLDWQMWIASSAGGIDRSPWICNFLLKLLQQDRHLLSLLDYDPWAVSGSKPRYIRVQKYRYKFASPVAGSGTAGHDQNDGAKSYWSREYVGKFFPRQGILTEEMLRDLVLEQQHRA